MNKDPRGDLERGWLEMLNKVNRLRDDATLLLSQKQGATDLQKRREGEVLHA